MMKTYWEKGISFDKYIYIIEKKIEFKNDNPDEKIEKYHQALEKIEEVLENYTPNPDQENIFKNKNFKGKILIIAEDWCGDCKQTIPVITKFFNKNHVKILYRNENPDLMKLFLTNGSESVPIVLFLDEENNIINCWGPRTEYGTKLLSEHKNNKEGFSREKFISELQNYYDENKGFDVIQEILSII